MYTTEQRIADAEKLVDVVRDRIHVAHVRMDNLQGLVALRDQQIAELEALCDAKDSRITALANRVAELEALASRGVHS
jgi:hypothetical protein